jgi:hypothetical protein
MDDCGTKTLPQSFNLPKQELQMSAPSRRPEIRRRRTRKEKIQKLRKQLTAAGGETDRTRISAKLAKLAQKSPGEPIVRP